VEFVSIDVETANADMASICQIGAVRFIDGVISDEWKTYVNPEDYFDSINISIHGIDESDVIDAPNFQQTAKDLNQFLDGQIVVCHTHFDRVAIHQSSIKHGVSPPNCIWLDSARVARRTWEEFASRGYGLSNICKFLGYEFKHHDALEDAKASGHILLAAMTKSGLNLEDWLQRIKRPINPDNSSSGASIKRLGNSAGALLGEIIVFTGALEIPRNQAADIAHEMGCQVAPNVTKKTTILVVGDQDIQKLAGHAKSNKHRKVEDLISKGQSIRIICERDFQQLAQH